ncbi:MAG TPA: S1C family serine protease [bacterium]|nr:S1C family serine protease [bacterium]
MRAAVAIGCVIALAGLSAGAAWPQTIEGLEKEITGLVDRTGESVVSIGAYAGPLGSRQAARSVGCGVVFDQGGLIVTTASIVGAASEVEITTRHGAKYTGKVLGMDAGVDLAVVKAEGAELRPATFSRGRTLPPGSLVFVVGNAFGSLPSVSMGVVSGTAAPASEEEGAETLRLSVAIYPGDMGAPVIDARGEVVGLLVGRISLSPMAYASRGLDRMPSNMSVAVPAERVLALARDIVKTGTKERGFLGVRVMDLSDDMKTQLGNRRVEGVVVTEVLVPSPADSVGIAPGDIITALGPGKIPSVSSLLGALEKTKPGDVVAVSYQRGGQESTSRVRVSRFVSEYARQQAKASTPEPVDLDGQIKYLHSEINRLEAELKDLESKK